MISVGLGNTFCTPVELWPEACCFGPLRILAPFRRVVGEYIAKLGKMLAGFGLAWFSTKVSLVSNIIEQPGTDRGALINQ